METRKSSPYTARKHDFSLEILNTSSTANHLFNQLHCICFFGVQLANASLTLNPLLVISSVCFLRNVEAGNHA
jgi:hypothetical protein